WRRRLLSVQAGDLPNPFFYSAQRRLGSQVVASFHGRARFLHILIHAGQQLLRLAQVASRSPAFFRVGDPRVGLGQQRGDFGHRTFDFAAHAGAGFRRLPGRVLRAFTALEGVVESQAVVALGDGVVGGLE